MTANGKPKRFALGTTDREDAVRALQLDRLSFATACTSRFGTWIVDVVEFHHAGLNQYFMTAKPDQVARLDSLGEAVRGWRRFGESSAAPSAWGDTAALPMNGNRAAGCPVERFYGDLSGPNMHFYTANTIGRGGETYEAANNRMLPNRTDEMVLRTLEIANAGNPRVLHYEGIDFREKGLSNADGSPTRSATLRCTDPSLGTFWAPG